MKLGFYFTYLAGTLLVLFSQDAFIGRNFRGILLVTGILFMIVGYTKGK